MDKERLEKIKQKYSNANIIEHINGIDIIAVNKAELELFISTIEEQQEEINHLKDCETQLIKIRSLLANYDFSPGVSELSVAKPEGIYELVAELNTWYEEALSSHECLNHELFSERMTKDRLERKLNSALEKGYALERQVNKLTETLEEISRWDVRSDLYIGDLIQIKGESK